MFNYVEMWTICIQVEEEAREEIEAWEKDHGRTFLVEGVPFVQYIERQWTTFREQKELEKQERVSKKKNASTPPPLPPLFFPHPPKTNAYLAGTGLINKMFYVFVLQEWIYICYRT